MADSTRSAKSTVSCHPKELVGRRRRLCGTTLRRVRSGHAQTRARRVSPTGRRPVQQANIPSLRIGDQSRRRKRRPTSNEIPCTSNLHATTACAADTAQMFDQDVGAAGVRAISIKLTADDTERVL
jgi:hypothetical protein